MSGIFGALNLSDTDRVFSATVGQRAIYDLAMQHVAMVNAELDRYLTVFVERDTTDHKLRYKLPGGGYLMRRDTQARYGAVKVTGSWDVAFPLEDFGAEIASDDVSRAYMTVQELENHINTVVARNVNTVRFEMLNALLGSVQGTFVDPLWGSLSIEGLANGDSVVYPPVLGAVAEAADNHYISSGYATTAISDTNNPFATIRDELEEHFGAGTGGENLAVFINQAQRAKVEGIADFDEVPDQFVRVGDNTAVPQGLPNVPGRILGRCSGCWVVEWRWMPAAYMMGIHLDAPKPLMRRVDPADTGLGRGLQLVAEDGDYPFSSSVWRHRFGFGCGNRLNGVVMFIDAGAWAVPSGYA